MTDTTTMTTNATTVELDAPIKRGKIELTSITVNKPRAGALMGVSLYELMQMNASAVAKVLPRVTEPALTDEEVTRLDPADLVQFASAVCGFLLTRKVKAEAAAA